MAVEFAPVRLSTDDIYLGNGGDSTIALKSGWDASVRTRIGYLATPTLLVYATGGAAWMQTEITSNCGPVSCVPGQYSPAVLTQSSVQTGWTIGGGIESVLASNWLLRAEYRYTDYGTASYTDHRTCSPSPSPSCGIFTALDVSYDIALRTHTATVGLAYKF
jgi:outer membrane immunogenic protein